MARGPETWTGEKAELDRCREAPLADLVRHIVDTYHRDGRVELARMETQAEEAALLEGRACPRLFQVRDEVERFCAELRAHFRHEERIVFPALLELADGVPVPAAVRDPLGLLQDEHEAASGLLQRIHQLTEGFQAPSGAQAAQRDLFETFQRLADSLRRHIYLENQVLFKRVLHNRAD